MYNKTIIRFGFVISRIVKDSVRVISRSRFWISQTPHPIIVNVAQLDFQKKILGPAGPQVFNFVTRTSILVAKNYI